MKIKSKHEFKCCDPEQVWEKLMDIDLLGSIISDRRGLQQVSRNKYEGKLPVEAGPLNGKLATSFTLKGKNKPKQFLLNVKGKLHDFRVSVDGGFSLKQAADMTTARYQGSLKLEMVVHFPVHTRVRMPEPVEYNVKKSLEKTLKKLFRKIEAQCNEENSNAH